MDDLIDCKKQSHDTNSFTEHHILVQCKTKRTENFFKCGEGYTLNKRRLSTGDELQSFDVFGKHLSVFKIFVYLRFVGICDCVHTNPGKKYDQYFLSTFYKDHRRVKPKTIKLVFIKKYWLAQHQDNVSEWRDMSYFSVLVL